MSIEINLRPRKYTLDELRELYSRYSADETDFKEWLSAMQKTKQLSRRENKYIPTDMDTEKKITKPYYKTYETVLAGGRSDAEYPRIGIKTLISEKTRIDPTEMVLVQYMDSRGRWIDIPERPRLSLQSPRESEKWRAEVVGFPVAVRKKYKIKIGTQLKVKITGTITRYFSKLKLWGYKIGGMISYGETSKHKEDRQIEVRAANFNMQTNGEIKNDITKAGQKLIKTIKSWLETYDIEYYNFLNRCGGLAEETTPPHKGAYIEPLETPPGKQTSEIEFEDMDGKQPAVTYTGIIPYDWADEEESTLAGRFFITGQDYVVHEYKGRNRTFKKKGKTTKKYEPYTTKQTQLKFENKPGFKRKK